MLNFLFLILFSFSLTSGFAQDIIHGRTEITEEDLTPSTFPYQIKFQNGSVTDNGDGTTSIAVSINGTSANLTSLIVTGNSTLQNVSATVVNATTVNGRITGYYNSTETLALDNFTNYYNKTHVYSGDNVSNLTWTKLDNVPSLADNYTEAKFNASFANRTTDNLTQGSTNKYANTTKEDNGQTAFGWGNHVNESTTVSNTPSINLTLATYNINATTNTSDTGYYTDTKARAAVNGTTLSGNVVANLSDSKIDNRQNNVSVQSIQLEQAGNNFTHSHIQLINSSNATFTVTNTSGKLNITVDAASGGSGTTFDNFTIVNSSQGWQVANWIPDLILSEIFYRMVKDAANATQFPYTFIDVYNSSSYIDASASLNESYNASMSYYEPTISYGANFCTGGIVTEDTVYTGGQEGSKAFDGNLSTYWSSTNGAYPHWVQYDLGVGITATARQLCLNAFYSTHLYLKDFVLYGSNNNSTWTSVYSGQTTDVTGWQNFTFANTAAYRYYNLTITSNWVPSNYATINEIEIQPAIVNNMTLISVPFVTTTNSSNGRLWGFVENTSAWTLNTDLKGYISNNNGTNWDLTTLYQAGIYGANKTIVACNVTNFTGLDKNTTYKWTTLNNKLFYIKGTGVNVNATF